MSFAYVLLVMQTIHSKQLNYLSRRIYFLSSVHVPVLTFIFETLKQYFVEWWRWCWRSRPFAQFNDSLITFSYLIQYPAFIAALCRLWWKHIYMSRNIQIFNNLSTGSLPFTWLPLDNTHPDKKRYNRAWRRISLITNILNTSNDYFGVLARLFVFLKSSAALTCATEPACAPPRDTWTRSERGRCSSSWFDAFWVGPTRQHTGRQCCTCRYS